MVATCLYTPDRLVLAFMKPHLLDEHRIAVRVARLTETVAAVIADSDSASRGNRGMHAQQTDDTEQLETGGNGNGTAGRKLWERHDSDRHGDRTAVCCKSHDSP